MKEQPFIDDIFDERLDQRSSFTHILFLLHYNCCHHTLVNGWSFQRQSHHSPLENNSYFHDLFVRDDPEKCLKMIRTGARKNAAGERVVPTDGRGLHVKKRKLILADGTDTPSTYDVVEIEDVRPIEGKGLSYVKRSMSVENKSSDQNIEGDSCDGCAVYDDGETTMYTFHSAPSPTKAATVDKI